MTDVAMRASCEPSGIRSEPGTLMSPNGRDGSSFAVARLAGFGAKLPVVEDSGSKTSETAPHSVKADRRNGGHLLRQPISAHPVRCLQLCVVCCDGTWMAPSDVHVQTAGAWEESWMARDPGGPLRPFPAKRQ